jgi:hypothetical protein
MDNLTLTGQRMENGEDYNSEGQGDKTEAQDI